MKELFPNIAEVAEVPRQVPDSWGGLVEEKHPLARVGFAAQLLGGLFAIIGIGITIISLAAWLLFGFSLWFALGFAFVTFTPIGVLLLGTAIRLMVKTRAISNGRRELEQTPVALAAVVQANHVLFDPDEAETAPAVLVWADSGPLQHNPVAIQEVARRLQTVRETGGHTPEQKRLARLLRDENSNFVNEPLPESVVGAPNLYWTVTYIPPDTVGGCLPGHGLLPILFNQSGLKSIIPAFAW